MSIAKGDIENLEKSRKTRQSFNAMSIKITIKIWKIRFSIEVGI